MGKKTTKKSETDAEGRKKMVEAAVDLLQGKYADLPGSDERKCRDEALLEDVRVKMGWDYAPSPEFLFDELRLYREQLNAPEPEKTALAGDVDPELVKQVLREMKLDYNEKIEERLIRANKIALERFGRQGMQGDLKAR